MVKSLASCLLALASASVEPGCQVAAVEDEVVSALQQHVKQRVDGAARREGQSVSVRLAEVFKQLSEGSSQICVAAEEGEVVPVAGLLTSDDGVAELTQGAVVERVGRFCADRVTVLMLQRSSGLSSAVDVERSVSGKKRSVESSVQEKGTRKPSPKPSPGDNPKPTPTPEPTPEPEPTSTPSPPGPITTVRVTTPSPAPPTPSPSDQKGDYPELAQCASLGPDGMVCGGKPEFCRLSVILNNCGSVENACCSDEDESCSNGSDMVKCITADVNEKDYGTLPQCTTTYGSFYCEGTNQYGCTKAQIETACGSLSNACCADKDESCDDGDDKVKCVARITTSTSTNAPDAPPYGSLPSCNGNFYGQFYCSGDGIYGCNQDDIVDGCGSLDNACCNDDDGSCEDGDDDVRCIASQGGGGDGSGNGNDSTSSASPPDYGAVPLCNGRETSGAFCSGTNQYGCTQQWIDDKCGEREACCADDDGSCADGDDKIKCLVNTSPPSYGTVDGCGQRGHSITICSGTNTYSCTEEHIKTNCGSVSRACCVDEDGSCADGDDAIACLTD